MTKGEMTEFLKEKLTVRVEVSKHRDWDMRDGQSATKVKVSIYLDKELICEDSDYAG